MMAHDFIVLGIDVMSYSQKPLDKQVYAQDLLDRVLADALACHSEFQNNHWIDGGDGGYLLLTGDSRRAVNLIETFLTALSRENSYLQEEGRAYVRCAVHYDAINIKTGRLGEKYTGNAINVCARLLNGMGRNQNQVVCSSRFIQLLTAFKDHKEVITRLPDISDKHGNIHEMYNIKRDNMGIVPNILESHPDPLKRFFSA